jgi:phosphatidylglycerophosphate synthase
MEARYVVLHAIWRNTPNAISIARLCATAFLLTSVLHNDISVFKWLLLACLLSDIADGLIARAFQLSSKLGAALDSAADMLTMLIGLFGVYVFQRTFVNEHLGGVLLVMCFYFAEAVAALIRYGKLSSFHTLLDRIAAYAGGIFGMSLFLFGYHDRLFYFTVIIYVVSLVEEMILICLLPEWRTDVGNVFRVLAKRRSTA